MPVTFDIPSEHEITIKALTDVWHMPRDVVSKIPYFHTLMTGPWKDAGSPIIDLTTQVQEGNVVALGIAAALLWTHAPIIPLRLEARSWKDLVRTAMYLGCFDAKYVAALADLVVYEEVDVFDVTQWIRDANITAQHGTSEVFPLLVNTIITVFTNMDICTDFAKFKMVPNWLAKAVFLKDQVPSVRRYFWLCEVSRYLVKTEAESSTDVVEHCWAHDFMRKLNITPHEGYPFRCPLCSTGVVAPHPRSVKRVLLLRPNEGSLLIDVLYGVLAVSEAREIKGQRKYREAHFMPAPNPRPCPRSLMVSLQDGQKLYEGTLTPNLVFQFTAASGPSKRDMGRLTVDLTF